MKRGSPVEAEAKALACLEALSLYTKWTTRLATVPVSTTSIAELLGIEVKRVSGSPHPGRLVYANDWSGKQYTIVLRADLPAATERFVMAHEIGHAVLLKHHPHIADTWGLPERETFASTFAHQMLIPPTLRDQVVEDFRAVDDPSVLLDLAGRLGLWPHTLLRFADSESRCLRDLGKIWVRAKHLPNRYTGLEARLRIVTAHYDRQRYFVPSNQSLSTFCGDETWLSSSEPGKVTRYNGEVVITERQLDRNPQTRRARLTARLSGTRLSASVLDGQPVFLVLVDLDPVTARRNASVSA